MFTVAVYPDSRQFEEDEYYISDEAVKKDRSWEMLITDKSKAIKFQTAKMAEDWYVDNCISDTGHYCDDVYQTGGYDIIEV